MIRLLHHCGTGSWHARAPSRLRPACRLAKMEAPAEPRRSLGLSGMLRSVARGARRRGQTGQRGYSMRTLVYSVIGLGVAGLLAYGVVLARSGSTTDVDVRVWQSTSDAQALYISARPDGGSWRTLGTIPLGEGAASEYETTANGRFRYSDITLAVPLDEAGQPGMVPRTFTTPRWRASPNSRSNWQPVRRLRLTPRLRPRPQLRLNLRLRRLRPMPSVVQSRRRGERGTALRAAGTTSSATRVRAAS